MPPLDSTDIAARHRVVWWSPSQPRALLICADGDGAAAWTMQIADADLPVAVIGIESGGLQFPDTRVRSAYRPEDDPRARAYLPRVDPDYFRAHLDYVMNTVLPWADGRISRTLPRITFGFSNGAVWAASAAAARPSEFAAVIAFSMGAAPGQEDLGHLPHALAAGKREAPFLQITTAYAAALRRAGVPLRLRTPDRGHEYDMWAAEFRPALRWVLDQLRIS
ncbi:MAG TPA: alpha/beta hydrolase-fold protein [Gaiellaceae bacterium]